MIYTVTFNPSLDYMVHVDDLTLGTTNRTLNEQIAPGGKGINVSLVLKNLCIDSAVLGFVGGFTGEQIEKLCKEKQLNTKFIHLKEGTSRINVKIASKEETEINGKGPSVLEDLDLLYGQLDDVQDGDVLVLSGSVPSMMSDECYKDILGYLKDKNIEVVVDATGFLLTKTFVYKPFLIKPNQKELEAIFNVKMKNKKDVIFYAKKLQEQGARNVIVSLGKDGAVMVTEKNQELSMKAPIGTLVNSVGSGDSLVAGFLAKYLDTNDFVQSFYYGVCTGSASAFSETFATKEEVEKLYQNFGEFND